MSNHGVTRPFMRSRREAKPLLVPSVDLCGSGLRIVCDNLKKSDLSLKFPPPQKKNNNNNNKVLN